MPPQHLRPITKLLCCLALFALEKPALSRAGGFALLEQSAEGNGVAYAGATAGYSDGSAVFFNPGAMSRHDYTVLSAGASILSPNAKFENQGSYAYGGAPLSGDNGPNGGVTGWVPSIYAVQPTEIGLTLGIGVNVPFGTKTEYSRSWVGRYSAVDSELTTISLSPAASYAVTEDFSIGSAINVLYSRAEITNAVDFGTIGAASLGPVAASSLGLRPQTSDGYAKVTGDDFGVGATAGFSYSYAPGSRLGIAYRSPIRLTLRGDADFTVPANAQVLTSQGAFVDTDAKADLTLPDSISAGIIHKLSEEWDLLGDVQWTHWAWFDELRVKYSSAQPDTVVNQNWDNAWRGSLGTQFRPIKRLRLSAGFSYDQEPISDRYHRTPRLPGNDRYWTAFGAAYRFTDRFSLDLGYAHIFAHDAKSEVASPSGDVLKGNWDLGTDIISAGLVARF